MLESTVTVIPESLLRDYFAGQAMQNITPPHYSLSDEQRASTLRKSARTCYELADAMLAARKVGASLPPAAKPETIETPVAVDQSCE